MFSMTAFARVSKVDSERTLVWELRSVNHRYLEHQFRLPEMARGAEGKLRDSIRKRLKRGKVDCTLRIEQALDDSEIRLNHARLKALVAVMAEVDANATNLSTATALDILRWPGILQEQQTDEDALQTTVIELFEAGLEELIHARGREGEKLKATVSSRLDKIESLVAELTPFCESLANAQKDRLIQRLSDLSVELDSGRLEQEAALAAQRLDVAEELDRLSIHVQEARNNLDSTGPHGRRLDFLTQELNREANTLGSKSILAETSQRAVDLKVIIEQIREQVQNIE